MKEENKDGKYPADEPADVAARVKAIQDKHANMLNSEEKIIHEKIDGVLERRFSNRREINHLERLFQDRIKGVIGLRVKSIKANGDSLLLHCSDNKDNRRFRIYLTHSRYGNTLRLSVTEIIFRKARATKATADEKSQKK